MKTTRYLFLMLLMALFDMSVKAQQRNVLQVPDLNTQTGDVQLPVSIENTDEIVGLQFDLTLPEGVTAINTPTMAARGDGHSITANAISNRTWRVIIISPQNRPLRGQSGVVMYLSINIPSSFEEGSEHPLAISNAVLGKATGENVITETLAGSIRIAKLPDLTVNGVSGDKQTLNPGDRFLVSWQVENIGELATGGGWSEQVSLVSEDGIQSKLIATTHYGDILAPGGQVSRQTEVALPFLLGIDGQAKLQVRIVPDSDCGEMPAAQGNNTIQGTGLIAIGKMLGLELLPQRVVENSGRDVALKLSRSGSWGTEGTFTINVTKDSRVSAPSIITIPANQSGGVVYLHIDDNDALDNDSVISVSVTGNGYPSVAADFVLEDNELPSLTLTAKQQEVNEGETFRLTVSTNRVSEQPIPVTLTCEEAKRFSFPTQVVIPAGETSTTIDVTATGDDLPNLETLCVFTVAAPNHNPSELIMVLVDDDLPVLELILTPNTIQESAGGVAVAGVLRRTTKTNSKITVKLTDNANGGLYFSNRTLELAKGVEEVHFNFGPMDNQQVEGDRTYTVTAAVWLSSCSCSASGESAGSVSSQLQVLDDDGPSISLTSSQSTLNEGGSLMLTVSRNTVDTSSPLAVALGSDYDDGLNYSHSVIIPAGQQTVTVEVTSTLNEQSGDSHTVVFTAQAQDFASGTCYIMVTDQTLPDAVITSITADKSEAEVGEEVTLSVEVSNGGNAPLPEALPVVIYERGENNIVARLYVMAEVPAGGKQIISKEITLPNTVGKHYYYAVINKDNETKELTYTNNTSETVAIDTKASFMATVSTDKAVYQQGETVILTGQLSGNKTAGAEVDVYFVNNGTRQVKKTTADEQGAFSCEWELLPRQSGHFIAGACYAGEDKKDEMATFDVYGLQTTATGYITCDVIYGETFTGKVGFVNPTVLGLTDVKAEVLASPDNCQATIDIPSAIAPGETVHLNYSLTGKFVSPERQWSEIKVRVSSAEGPCEDITLYFYCRSASAKLECNTQKIKTTVTQGTTRDYVLQLVNSGKGETGKISLALPPFMSCTSGNALASLGSNDTTLVVLNIGTTDKMQLNVPVTGTIGINCENGDGLSVNFSIEPVSEEKGFLQVDVCDEYTYNTAEAPHVANASVIIRHPYTDQKIAEGTTGEDGKYLLELPAGYYKVDVSADRHELYSNYCYVNPGKTENLTVNVSYQAITFTMEYEETEVEDEYEIVTKVVYETNVPMPVVKVAIPECIDGDNMAVGDATMIDMTLTNVGLIRADNIEYLLPQGNDEWKFEALGISEGFSLNPQQSVVVPIRITRVADTSQANSRLRYSAAGTLVNTYGSCMVGLGTRYQWMCGDELKNNAAAERLAMKFCATAATVAAIADALGNIFGGGGPGCPGGGGGSGGGGGYTYNEVTSKPAICDPCEAARLEEITNFALGFTWMSMFNTALDRAIKAHQMQSKERYVYIVKDVTEEVAQTAASTAADIKFGEGTGKLVDAVVGVYKVVSACDDIEKKNEANARGITVRKASKHSWINEFDAVALDYIELLSAMDTILLNAYGDRIWYEDLDEEKLAFLNYVNNLPENYVPSDEELLAHQPSAATMVQMRAYVDHIHSLYGDSSSDELSEPFSAFERINQQAQEKGFTSATDWFVDAYNTYQKKFEELTSNSVCASITLQFKQTMTMTRQAFRGTLTVFNGHDDTPMRDVKLNLVVKDPEGKVATSHEFQINAESLKTFDGALDLTGGWTLDAQQTGIATVLFIPTKYAAPDAPVDYSFGGSLTYIDPFTGLEVTRNLYPVTLTVKPSPELDLTYFMQRDVYGDDPLTEAVEPMVPAEFALLINNKGNGDATNVRMQTQQPEIIDNEKGLLINFELISSQVNGGEANLSFGQTIANDFGTIPAHSQMYAQWWLTSSLLGHFTDYQVEATHVTSYGNEDLSLLDDVSIHELIHGFTVRNDEEIPVRGFLVNEIMDAEDTPDSLFFTDATHQSAHIALDANMVKQSDTDYLLIVSASTPGWNYGSLLDPTYGRQKLASITRQSDGAIIPVDNMWQTSCTLRDGKDPLYENRLHFVGNMPQDGETYLISFEPKPDVELAVDNFADVPGDDTVLKQQLTSMVVKFNKPVKAETFTTDDITLSCQGVAQDVDRIVIEQQNEQEYNIKLNEVTLLDGYYVLTVQTTGIEDNEGFNGSTGKSATWIQFVDGKVALKVTVYPAEGGTVSPGSGRFDYGSDISLKATPAEGYEFTGWTGNGLTLSSDRNLSYHIDSDAELKAMFAIKHFNVNIDCDPLLGMVEGAATGIYDYGTQLEMMALPAAGYVFDAWMIDGERKELSDSYSLKVDRDVDVRALFKEDVLTELQRVDGDRLQVTIAPLPLRDYMLISCNFDVIPNVCIYDMRGAKVLAKEHVQVGQGIYVGGLNEGVYILRVTTDKGHYVVKVLKK